MFAKLGAVVVGIVVGVAIMWTGGRVSKNFEPAANAQVSDGSIKIDSPFPGYWPDKPLSNITIVNHKQTLSLDGNRVTSYLGDILTKTRAGEGRLFVTAAPLADNCGPYKPYRYSDLICYRYALFLSEGGPVHVAFDTTRRPEIPTYTKVDFVFFDEKSNQFKVAYSVDELSKYTARNWEEVGYFISCLGAFIVGAAMLIGAFLLGGPSNKPKSNEQPAQSA